MRPNPGSYGLYDPQTEHDACGVGFVAHIKGEKSHAIVEQGLELLRRLAHRAATGCDPETGDGAGILLQLSHRFFKARGLELGWDMPRRRRYAVGMVFLPPDPEARAACERVIEEAVVAEGQRVIGWRDVPVDDTVLGRVAFSMRPVIRQVFVARRRLVPSAFERKLFVIRKLAENRIRDEGLDPDGRFHIASLSSETIVYKGLLLPRQLPAFYADLRNPTLVSAIALVHSRFSTNTFPTWDLAQPLRYVAHNGEINTVRGNRNWMNARRSQLQSAKFDGGVDRLFPIVVPDKSDSSQFDNMLELLVLGGRPLPHAMMMMIPEAWEGHDEMDPARRAFYEYTAALMEPWDGPAAIAFTDGHLIGATLDRNGLRPCRYLVTRDDLVVLASETGVIDVPPERIKHKGRLRPGKMLLVDTVEGRFIDDDEAKGEIVQRWPYRRWLTRNVFQIDEIVADDDLLEQPALAGDDLRLALRAFGYTDECLRILMAPMAQDAAEPVGSMGNDAPIAALSDRAPLLYDYFHQLFAQVTNPAIDPIRERLVMSLETAIGQSGNTFEETPEQCHRLNIAGPVLTNAQLARVRGVEVGVFEPTTLSTLFCPDDGPDALEQALESLCQQAEAAVDDGFSILILSDRGVDARRAPIPALLALSAVHQHLVREGTRMQTGLLVETGEAREVHHFAALLGFGAAAVNPYLAFDALRAACDAGEVALPFEKAAKRYCKAVDKGLLKVMSKMGISTLQSYRGAQIFEAVGVDPALIARHFTGTPARLAGADLGALQREAVERHARAYGPAASHDLQLLPVGGVYQWRRRGEHHQWNPRTIALLQDAARRDDAAVYRAYEQAVDAVDGAVPTLRALLTPTPAGDPVPLDEVEPAAEIAKRFVTGAMSFGSISAEAHETLAIAMNRIGGRSNSGEGGEEPHRFTPDANGDLRRSAIKQVASGRFGVTVEYLVNADDLQIKIAQGAKPGEGGQLPGHKVDDRIAKVRCSTPGVTLISPPPHHDIYSIEDLKQLIYDLKAVNPKARVSVKLVAQVGVGTVAAGVTKAGADAVVIAGWSGGTGASPLSSLKHAGVPWEMGLAEAQQVLVHNDLRGRVRLQVDGGFRTSRDVIVAAMLGGEEFGFATSALIVEGCIMLRKCHKNTCSVGVATQDPELRKRFAGHPDHVVHFFLLLAEAVRQRMAELGVRRLDELVGRVDLLRREPVPHWKAERLDLAPLLAEPAVERTVARRHEGGQPDVLFDHLDHLLLRDAAPAIERGKRTALHLDVRNTHRSVGAMLSGAIARRNGAGGLPDGTLTVRLDGSAGQSFGAFLAPGVTFALFGDANDYFGKGLSGGRIVVRPPEGARFAAHENVIIGNTALYGATGGEVFVSGLAGERFGVRNSGARAVVEGTGDHGCEYMTGGVVVVLGPTGRNFAAGMSGGVAYVFDRDGDFRARCNPGMVELESVVDESDIWLLATMIEDHVRHTDSTLGRRLLDNWEMMLPRFVKVMPTEYKRVLQRRRAARRPASLSAAS
ncbi:MAG: glutamate synthase large subunit [Myxococcales bacterium]|nr:glutamate synthase large subunit [Myxococcales bacterium]